MGGYIVIIIITHRSINFFPTFVRLHLGFNRNPVLDHYHYQHLSSRFDDDDVGHYYAYSVV